MCQENIKLEGKKKAGLALANMLAAVDCLGKLNNSARSRKNLLFSLHLGMLAVGRERPLNPKVEKKSVVNVKN